MKLLILGGTVFLGRHLVEAALERGHEVTLFNRGQHNPELFPEVEKLRGDRGSDMAALEGRHWDAVIDTSGYVPRVVQQSARMLADAVEHYTFISSISVYATFDAPGLDENTPVATLDDPHVEEITGETYGALKALCEQAAEEAMPGRVLVLRPGLIVGPHDPTDRFSYWVARTARGGEVLAPGQPERQIQIIDARDLAQWNLRMVEARQTGVFNATGPDDVLTMGDFLDTCKSVTQSDASFTWTDEAFLLKQGVAPWQELPLWMPSSEEDMQSILQVSIARATAAGLRFRPLADTVRDTYAWLTQRLAEHEWRAGLAPERETEDLWQRGAHKVCNDVDSGMTDAQHYTIGELAKAADTTPRTIRYYTAEGLLPPPDARGRYALYNDDHLVRLQLIARLKESFLPLHEIRARIAPLPTEQVRQLLEEGHDDSAPSSAADYVSAVLRDSRPAAPPAPIQPSSRPIMQLREEPQTYSPVPAAPPSFPLGYHTPQPASSGVRHGTAPPQFSEERNVEDERWRRVTLAPGVELHLREPLAAEWQERIAQLIAMAHKLFERGTADERTNR